MADLLDHLHEIRRELMPGPRGPCQHCGQPAARAERCLNCRKHRLRSMLACSDEEADSLIAKFVRSTRENLEAIRALVAVRLEDER